MPKLNNQKRGWTLFLKLCQQLSNQNKIEQLFELLLTPEEKEDLSGRCLIIEALLQNEITQRDIAATFNVSISKITRGSNALKGIDPKLKNALHQFFEADEDIK